jgi:hypothetical protein
MKNLPDGFYLVTYDDNYEKAVVRKVNYEVIGIKSFNPKYGKSAYNYTIFSDGWDSYKIQKYGIKHYYETL